MASQVFRYFTEKKSGYDVEAQALAEDLRSFLNVGFSSLRIFLRYDIEGLAEEHREVTSGTVLGEPMCDIGYVDEMPPLPPAARVLCIEPLPGQFDQRAASCEQCIQMLLGGERPTVRSARILAVDGISARDFEKVREYMINPVETCEGSAEKPETLLRPYEAPGDIPALEGLMSAGGEGLDAFIQSYGLAMSRDDLACLRDYFKAEGREPTLTELRVVDTYWSDHCRHTTFNTVIYKTGIYDRRVKKAYELYLAVKGDRPVTLMGIAQAAMRSLRDRGALPMLDESDENNACTVKVTAEIAGREEEWLLFFKNETHNHPTEIEPFGGAATCIGGAIRDPLSGRGYVYQAMRITGAGDPRAPLSATIPGKLPQRRLTTAAAAGYSSYGNQIGLATGYVKEIYHQGYIAKRMEVGAVVGAAPVRHVRREAPAAGDVVVLLGGRTGRDGIGGATGSSKTHDESSVTDCAAEVQKGNPPEERKLQRLFRRPDAAAMIKKCNDFGAGGVAVAVGELADGLEINLDAVPRKYEGLDGTELAISESQERMAVVLAAEDAEGFIRLASEENLEANVIARVTGDRRMTMLWRGRKIVNLSRDFLDTNGARRYAAVEVPGRSDTVLDTVPEGGTLAEKLLMLSSDLNFCSQKGLVERFDGSIGSGSVFMPHGGEHALTETQVMAALLPAEDCATASVMSYGFDPGHMSADPFGGAVSSVVTSVAKLVACGARAEAAHLSLQEYFPRLKSDPMRWGMPFAAVLGAFSAQMGLGTAAIGGKDSMSGSFNELDVPPTLISFAVAAENAGNLISPEFKAAGHPVYLLEAPVDSDGLPDYGPMKDRWKGFTELCRSGKILSGWACEKGGVYGAIMKMSLGNRIGFAGELDGDRYFSAPCGSIVFEAAEPLEGYRLLGETTERPKLRFGKTICPVASIQAAWEAPLEGVFPTATRHDDKTEIHPLSFEKTAPRRSQGGIARPRAVIPVFPGTNCETDTAAALMQAGADAETVIIRNLTASALEESIAHLERAVRGAQMLVLPGGFSGGDEPDGSGKYIVSFFKNPRLTDAVHDLLYGRDGLVLGICNGFQALIKLGLLPFGRIRETDGSCPTLTYNAIGRHQSRYVTTRVCSVFSPWLSKCRVGDLYHVPVSHGEGRLMMSDEILARVIENGQAALQYTDRFGKPSMDSGVNPNGSVYAIEGLCSPDGRILGKMAHSERRGRFVARNISGEKLQPLFEGGVDYFR